MDKLRSVAFVTVAMLSFGCSVSMDHPERDEDRLQQGDRGADSVDHGASLHELLEAQWEEALDEYPEFATYLGDPRNADKLTDSSMAAIERRNKRTIEQLAEFDRIDRDKLSPADQLNYDLYVQSLKDQIDGIRFPGEYLAINQMGGAHQSMAQLAAVSPKQNVKDVENFISRLRGVPKVIDDTIDLLERGLADGITPPRITLVQVENLIGSQITEDPKESPVYTTYFATLPDSISESERERLQAKGAAVLSQTVMPAYQKLRDYWVRKYYPGTRDTIGLSDLPNGAEWYAYNVRQMTTTDLTPDEIHQIGLNEVARIRKEMELVRGEAGFDGSLEEFFEFLKTDEQFFFTEKDDLLRGYRDIAKRADAKLPTMFRTIPRLPYGVEPVPSYSERTQTTAYYQPGSIEAARPGTFFANTYDLASRPKWEMEALTLHEAVPGHHFQIAIAQELGEVPNFRKYGGYTAFVEGWGLYSESLGEEMGFYADPYSKFGQLTYEMWRAIRLVVDTGMHSKGWTRQQSIDFFKANAGKSEHDITVEVDRYIVWPGQALAYKIGELKIKELRAWAEKELGDSFDVREFHDTVLGAGAVPLSLLEERIHDWVSENRG